MASLCDTAKTEKEKQVLQKQPTENITRILSLKVDTNVCDAEFNRYERGLSCIHDTESSKDSTNHLSTNISIWKQLDWKKQRNCPFLTP